MNTGDGVRSWLKRRAGVVGSVIGTTGPEVVLTYDDGPDPEHTRRILDELDRFEARATFFVLLTRTRHHPSIVREVIDRGHEVGLHGPDHRPMTDFDHGQALRRTRDARHELEDELGRAVRWFRPPYGAQSPATWLAVRRAGLTPVLWSASTGDWKAMDQQERVNRTLRDTRPGSIILAHDSFATVHDGARQAAAPDVDRSELAHLVLQGVTGRGLRVVSLGAALDQGSPVRAASFSRAVAGNA